MAFDITAYWWQNVDEKKSNKADLESKRITGFLLGLVVVLSIFIVLIEFNTQSVDSEVNNNLLDDLSQDIEMMPVLQRQDMIPAEIVAPPPSFIDKLNVVDTDISDEDDDEKLDEEKQIADSDDAFANGISGVLDIDLAESMNANTSIASDENDNPLDFRVVERLPEFPGGMVEFMKWLTKSLKYPMSAQQKSIEGKVLVAFIINKDGTVVAPKIVQSANPLLDNEALRVMRTMPKWKAGMYDGKPCRTYMCIPVVFKL